MGRSAEYAVFNRVPPFCNRLDVGPLMVPFRKLAHVRFPFPEALPLPESTGQAEQALDKALDLHTLLAATAALEESKCDEAEAVAQMDDEYARQSHLLRLPASVALPGLPSAFISDRYTGRKHAEFFQDWHAFDPTDTFERLQAGALSDLVAERAALEIAVTHRACATTGLGMVLDPVSANLFGEVAQLERHYRSGANKPAYVWKTLEKIGQEMGQRLTPLQRSELARASQITAFTNFPLGWTLLPGDTSPLMCRVPITYRPLLPLTRTLSSELHIPPIAYLGRSIRVLLAEVLPVGDPIRKASMEALRMIERDLQFDSTITIKVEETPDVDTLRKAIDSFGPAILLISSHGKHDLTRRTAGIEIGGKVCFGPELGQMPPAVILSTCHNAPRSTGAVNIAELLLRQGAMTVLGTQVPVNVYHNALLMVRFIVYIIESYRQNEPHRTLAEVWHRTAASNAINDILDGDKKLKKWAHTPVNGTTPIQEFMHPKTPSALRLGHIYRDSEARLLEIATRNKAGNAECGLVFLPARQPRHSPI